MEIHPGFEKWLTKDDKELPSPKDFIVYKYDGRYYSMFIAYSTYFLFYSIYLLYS